MKWQKMLMIASATMLMTASIAYGAPRTAGVSPGDWASYTITYEGNSTSIYIQDMLNMTIATYTVLNISGTNVTVEAHAHYENGSQTTETGWIDVNTGQSGGDAAGAGMMIAADLAQGDLVYTTAVEPFMEGTINETITRDYMGDLVAVNHFSLNASAPPNPEYNMSMTMDWYWYKANGVLAEIAMSYTVQTAEHMNWFNWHMTISNIVPEFPAVSVVPVLMMATLLIVAVSGKRAKRFRWMRA